jgi:hypothetical protein
MILLWGLSLFTKMDLFIQGKGKVTLRQADFVAQGGEASVYARGDTAFKVYTDPGRMIPTAKIQELSALTHAAIIRPQAILLDGKNQAVGYTMRRVQGAHVLCQVFNRAFRERQGLTPEAMVALVRKLQEGVQHVHAQGILIVDLNEMNFLLESGLQELLFIDVDSYQTPGFPATALMESVRDRHRPPGAPRFSQETDWFSFGIVSFQMFIGIHPYKGKHPLLADLDARMQQNVSVLNPQVSVPKVCYPFSVIPQAYLEWYRAVFEEGKRLPPPADLRGTITLLPSMQQFAAGEHLVLRELHRFPADVLLPVPSLGPDAALTTDGLYIGERKCPPPGAPGPDARIGITPRMRHTVAAWIEGRSIVLYDLTRNRRLPMELEGEALTTYGDRIYAKRGDGLHELEFVELPAGIRCTLRPVGNVMENATQLFPGVAVQSLLGAWHVSVFPRPGTCYPVRIRELDGYRVVDAKFDHNVLMVVGSRAGQYDRFVVVKIPLGRHPAHAAAGSGVRFAW